MKESWSTIEFAPRKTIFQIEEGKEFCPKFNAEGLLPVVTTEHKTNDILMLGYMNEEALKKTILQGEAFYYSRSRKIIWHKGAKSGFVQKVKDILIDDDQDALILKVEVLNGGASCHVGYRSCFYRKVTKDSHNTLALEFQEKTKVFDPQKVYPNEKNPTQI